MKDVETEGPEFEFYIRKSLSQPPFTIFPNSLDPTTLSNPTVAAATNVQVSPGGPRLFPMFCIFYLPSLTLPS